MHGDDSRDDFFLGQCCQDLTQLVRDSVNKGVEQETRIRARDLIISATSALEKLSPVVKAKDPTLDDQVRRSVFEFLRAAKTAIISPTVSPAMEEQVGEAQYAVSDKLNKVATMWHQPAYPTSPRTPMVPRPTSPEVESHSNAIQPADALHTTKPPPFPALSFLAISPTISKSPRETPPMSPSAVESFLWEEEDRITCLRAMEGVRKTMHVLELLGTPNPRAHSKEIVEFTREGLADLTFVRNRAECLGLALPAATLKACLIQLTDIIRQTLTHGYQEDEGRRIGKDIAISVRAIMFSRHFTTPRSGVEKVIARPMSPAPSLGQIDQLILHDSKQTQSVDKGKERLKDEDETEQNELNRNEASKQEMAMNLTTSKPFDENWLKESFRALESVKLRRKMQNSSEKESEGEETEKLRVRSVYVGQPTAALKSTGVDESPVQADADNADATSRKAAALHSGRMTVNIGAIDIKKQGNQLKSSHSMPDRMRNLTTSPSSFPDPVTSASDERVVGRRMTLRKPVLLTGYLDSTSFMIGRTVCFRLIINNMHKRPVKGIEMKLYKHTASFSYKQGKKGDTIRKVGSKNKVKVFKQSRTPDGFPVLQSKQWTGTVEFDIPSGLPPSVIADADATYEIVYTAKIKLQPKSCAIVLGPFGLNEA